MIIDRALQSRIRPIFLRFNQHGAGDVFSHPTAVTKALEAIIPDPSIDAVNVEPRIAALLATASVDMWLRSVHSLIVSASLSTASPIWASVSGYYASHYAVRGLAHLLGYFLLFTKKRLVHWSIHEGRHHCTFIKKSASDREHKLYWKRVKEDPHFQDDPFFTLNPAADDPSDIRHRDHANYTDSLFPYPNFRVLDEDFLKSRINAISRIEITDPPIPRLGEFPDLDNVQLIAYHRIVRYRQFLDEILADDSRFWRVHRNPPFAQNFLSFQVTGATGLSVVRQ